MLKTANRGSSLVEAVIIVAIGCVPVVSGLLVMHYQLLNKLEEKAATSVREAVYAVDLALDDLHEVALRAMPLANDDCSAAKSSLRKHINVSRQLYAVTLTRDGSATCGSLSGSDYAPEPFTADRLLRLTFNTTSLPNAVLVDYRPSLTSPGVVVSAYGLKLRQQLQGFFDGLYLIMEVGDDYIWKDGDSRDAKRPIPAEFPNRAVSTRYGYTIQGGYPEGFSRQELHASMRQVLPSLALVGLVTAAATYLGVFRHRLQWRRSRREEHQA